MNLQKVHDSEDTTLAMFGSTITRQRAVPNFVALAALVEKLDISAEGYPVCNLRFTVKG